jgi:uncharacterized membrane protein YoaK (UPF0700 family)
MSGHGGISDSEQQPLLGHGNGNSSNGIITTAKPPSLAVRLRRSMATDVSRRRADLILLFCYVITGLLDSSSISIWGAFVSMQTGNTVYVGLGLAAPSESTRWIKSGVSVLSFCLGSFFFSRLHRVLAPSPSSRWILCLSFSLQVALIVAAALLVVLGGPEPEPGSHSLGWRDLVPLALVAFQSCGQAVASRALKYNSLTSVVLTSIYCDLFSDAELFAAPARNVERNRRAAAPLLVLLGAFLGGIFARSSVSMAGALFTAAALKGLIVVAWVVWPGEEGSS